MCYALLVYYFSYLEKSNNVDVVYFDFAKAFDKVDGIIAEQTQKKWKLMVKSVWVYTIFYQTDNNVLPSMEQHQVKRQC